MFQKHFVRVSYIYMYIFIYSLYIRTIHLVTIKVFCFLFLLFTN